MFPSGEVQYLHPKDGVYPEKVNKGRVGVNNNMRSIGKNANPASIKFGGKLRATASPPTARASPASSTSKPADARMERPAAGRDDGRRLSLV